MKMIERLDKRDGVYEITPEDAAQILQNPADKNRPIRKNRVRRYANDIQKNRWKLTGEPILLSDNGALLDGQHRLSASVLTNKPIRVIILHGNWPFKHLGQGSPRSAPDVLAISGVPNSIVVAAIARLCIQHNRGMAREASMFAQTAANEEDWKFVHNDEIDTWVSKHLEITELASRVRLLLGKNALFPASPLAASWWLSIQVSDEETATNFWEPLCTGAGLEPGDVRLAIRRAYQGYRGSQRIKIGTIEAFADLAKVWFQRKSRGLKNFRRSPIEEFHYFR